MLMIILSSVALTACGSPSWKQPLPLDQVDFLTHAKSTTNGDITVTVAVPSKQETEALFGTSLYKEQIQPVWVKVENRSSSNYLLMKVGIDQNNFSPLEASYQRHSGSKETRLEMDKFFWSMDFENPAMAGTVTSGFVFTNLDEGFKAINIDLLTSDDLKSFSFVVRVDGLVTDSGQVDFESIYDEWIDIEDEQELRRVLASFPCCTANKDGDQWGDPLNVVMIGSKSDLFAALIRRGWHQTEISYADSLKKTFHSFLFGSRYRYSPISPLYVFGRPQDIGVQKARQSISLRNHMRLWRTRYNYQGKEIYLGQISRDIGVKFNKRTITTHAIDPDVDDTRSGLAADLAYSQALVKIAYVKGSQVSTMADTHHNLTPDPYLSDGLRVVLFFDERPTTLDKIEMLDWEMTRLHSVKKQ